MKINKGEAGYIRDKKNRSLLILIIEVVLILSLFLFGLFKNGTALNVFTFLGAIIAIPTLITLFTLMRYLPYCSINEAREIEITGKTEYLTVLYDLIIKSNRRKMSIRAVVISDNIVCAYTRDRSVKSDYVESFIKSKLSDHGISNITVRVFHDYVSFLSRAEGMQNMAAIEGYRSSERVSKIVEILKDISL